ncbi:hypothetical protein [Streptomyces sp. NPDC004682]
MLPNTESPLTNKRFPRVDFELDEFDADEDLYDDFHCHLGEGELIPLAEHHTTNGVHSYYVLFDCSATYGHPGSPQHLAVHLRRDQEKRTFSFQLARLPLPAMAQSWLIHRGCPPDAIGLNLELVPSAADETTRVLERRLVGDGDHYAMGFSCTRDHPDDTVILVALRALHEQSPTPFRVMVEEIDIDAYTCTLREGGFATAEAALHWCNARLTGDAGPLPPVRPAAAAARPPGLPKAPAPPSPGRLC